MVSQPSCWHWHQFHGGANDRGTKLIFLVMDSIVVRVKLVSGKLKQTFLINLIKNAMVGLMTVTPISGINVDIFL